MRQGKTRIFLIMNCEDCRKRKKCHRAGKVEGCKLFSVDSRKDPWGYRSCYICGRVGVVQEHHIFGGPLRRLADQEGLTIDLCPDHHLFSEHAAHTDKDVAQMLHELGQEAYEECYGEGSFLKRFGRNYL